MVNEHSRNHNYSPEETLESVSKTDRVLGTVYNRLVWLCPVAIVTEDRHDKQKLKISATSRNYILSILLVA